MDATNLSIQELQAELAAGRLTCAAIVDVHLKHATKANDTLGAFLRWRDEVKTEAASADARLAVGEPARPLEGVVVALKDNLMMQGEVTTAASKILEHYRATHTATVVKKLQAAGALLIGKTNLDEFAMGASTENSAFKVTRNPYDLERVPGGSSGGSAVAVSAGMATVALGSDTGGSIRQPAAFCSVVGMKPTYGRVSRYGLMALASSLDQIGSFGRSVEDAARLYQVIAGRDECDWTSSPEPVGDVVGQLSDGVKGLRIGLPKEFFGPGVDPEVAATIRAAAAVFEKLGATLTEVSIPHAPQALATYYVIQPAEASSNLARYDGIRYGLSVRENQGLEQIYRRSRAAGFGAEVKRRILIGTFALSAGYADAYYRQAVRVKDLLREEFHQVFDQVDVLLSPTTPTVPFALGANTQDPLTMYLADLLTVPANLAGIPALSMPAGFVDGLPVGVQLMTKAWDEVTLFRTAAAYEAATDWHTKRPPVASN